MQMHANWSRHPIILPLINQINGAPEGKLFYVKLAWAFSDLVVDPSVDVLPLREGENVPR